MHSLRICHVFSLVRLSLSLSLCVCVCVFLCAYLCLLAIGNALQEFPSPSLQKEALLALRTFVSQHPDSMRTHAVTWVPLIYCRLLSESSEYVALRLTFVMAHSHA
jgi:hypothetical protein